MGKKTVRACQPAQLLKMKVVSTRLAGAHAGQRQQAPWISASIRIPLSNIYKPIETENETLYPTHHRSVL